MFSSKQYTLSLTKWIPLTHHTRFGSQQSVVKKKLKETQHTIARIIKSYALTKYVNYVRNYDKVLEVRFPRAMKVYRVFSVGIKDFYQDSKDFVRVKGLVKSAKKNGSGIHSLAYKDVEIYYRMPREMYRVAPVLLISALPFANYVIFPIAYCFPKQLLSSQFWSLQQRQDFALLDHKKKVHYFRPTFRSMQERISSVQNEDSARDKLSVILSKLASGVHPTVPEILAVRILFQDNPFHLNCLYPRHKNQLLHIHGLHSMWSRRRRLSQRAREILDKDQALNRVGISSLSLDELKWACFSRGLNPTSMRTEDMSSWLNQWLAVSSHIDSSTLSLLLHCPILLAYNQPTNRFLIQY